MQDFVIMLLTCSATMSALGLVYMAITLPLAKSYSEKGLYYAWLIIVIGLIIPFRPHFSSAIITVDMPSAAVTPITQTVNPITINMPPEATTLPAAAPSFSIWQIAVAVWLVGMIGFIAYHAIQHRKFSKMAARWSESVTDEQTLNLLQNLKTEMGISRQIGLYSCPSVGGPALLGFVRPRILLPPTVFTPEELRFILKHELIHYKRGDLFYKCAVLIATAIHWFNPLVYLMARAIDAACELSCDAETVRDTGAEIRQQYSETIIGVIQHQSKLKTALSTHFYGGKRGMKKRIFSIMDTGRKKTGVAILCGVFILTMGTGMAFAANANKPPEQHDRLLDAQTVAETDQTMMSRIDPATGKTLYSWDLGKTWTPLTDEEYEAMFPTPIVEWWTYDGYKAWMEEQVASLQAIADDGVPDYYDKNDVLRDFTQADVDAFAANCQIILDRIENGIMVSKTIDGLTGTMMSYDPRDIMSAVETYASGSVSINSANNSDDYMEYDYAEYTQFGLSYRDGKLYYNGELVRCFDDWYSLGEGMQAGRSHFDKDGTVDVYAERSFSSIVHNPDGSYDPSGKLVGVRAAEQADFAARDLSPYTESFVPSETTADSMRESLYSYERFGVSYDEITGMMMYDGLPVRELYDHKPGTLVTLSAGTGFPGVPTPGNAIDLKTVYDGNVLTGLRKATQDEFDARTRERMDAISTYISEEVSDSVPVTADSISTISATSGSGSSNGSGRTISEIFKDYAELGIKFDEKSVNGGLGNIYYNGTLVKQFTDIAPDGSVLSCSSSDGGTISLLTVYDASEKIVGVEVIGA